jgi:hypothetical protein
MLHIEIDGIEYRFFDHLYAVSRCGKVLRKHQPYTPIERKDGYLSIGRQRLMHRVVAKCWLESFDPRKHVHHINGVKSDNRAENLECMTQSDHNHHHTVPSGAYHWTEERREKLRQYRTGRTTSEETKTKQREALIGKTRPYFARAAHSDESRKARSVGHVRNQSCSVNGVMYRSFAEASIATGIHRFTLRKRCLSKNFPEYVIFQK